jgi:hypothetical protein
LLLLAAFVVIYIFFVDKKPEEIMIKTLPLLCIFIFNAFAQCARIENNLYYTPDCSAFLQQAAVECVVTDKPDYFPPVSGGNGFSNSATSEFSKHNSPVASSAVYTALFECYNAFCKTHLAKQRGVGFTIRCSAQIAHVKTSFISSSEDEPLSAI